ncbi:caspase family protein [Actinoplanes sp. NPDC049265]|uniref:caspase, EACC1-associated type n=1 Tax=Actinoplanes sp. NPDC049265 TaxID=3363902 RepID=UPI00371CE973
MTDRYRALLIGNSTYPEDPHNLQTLEGPVNDITLLCAALLDRERGLFAAGSVTVRPERTSYEIVSSMEQFFGSATKDDVLLFYFSGHGRLDVQNILYLCSRDTRTDRLLSTAVNSRRLNEFLEASPASRTVIILDCCFSGAFKGADIGRALSGPRRYILSSCRGNELANDASVANHASMFTEEVVDGILHAPSSRPAAGHLTIEELFAYARDRLLEQGRQLPLLRAEGVGDLPIARRPAAGPDQVTIGPAVPEPEVTPVPRQAWRKSVAVAAGVLVAAGITAAAVALSQTGRPTTPTAGPSPGGASTSASVPVLPATLGDIRAGGDNCVEAEDGNLRDNAPVVLAACDKQPHQQFAADATDDPLEFKLRFKDQDRCLVAVNDTAGVQDCATARPWRFHKIIPEWQRTSSWAIEYTGEKGERCLTLPPSTNRLSMTDCTMDRNTQQWWTRIP